MIYTSREQRRQLARDNAKLPTELRQVARHDWPNPNSEQLQVWRSRDYLVQVFAASGPAIYRLSINRTTLGQDGRWLDGITWDTVQRIKREIGHGHTWAVEIFPADAELVNVANVRHLWLLSQAPEFAWRRGAGA